MTDLLAKAMRTAQGLPPALQDDIARVVLAFAGDDASIYQLTSEEEADLAESDAEVARGDFATDDEIRAMWAKHGLWRFGPRAPASGRSTLPWPL